MPKPLIVFLVGPTAVGKSSVALIIAKKLNAEIISCDSMQVYKGLDILSAKPKKTDLKKIPHHLLGVVSPTLEYDVLTFRKNALKKITALIKRKKLPLFVGGTGLYMSVLIDGILDVSAQD